MASGPSSQHPTSFLSFSSSASFSVSKALVRLMDFCKEAFSSSESFMYSNSLKDQSSESSRSQWGTSNCFRTELRVTLVNIVKKDVTGKLHRDQGCYACKFYLLRGRKGLAMHRHAEPACHCIHLNSKRQVNTVGRCRFLKNFCTPQKKYSKIEPHVEYCYFWNK